MSSGFATPVQRPARSRVAGKLGFGIDECITIPASPFMKRLGYGTGVSVYLYERSPGRDGSGRSPWAVKKTRTIAGKTKATDRDMERRLAKEAAILKHLNHPNIVGFRALTRGTDGSLCLSMEKGERALMDLIEEREEQGNLGPFPAKCIYQVAYSLAKALSYLHNTCHMLHGDLKSANVLIQGDFQLAKLCDFGVTLKLKKTLELEDEDAEYVGTQPWNAMEVVVGGTITNKTDMYSYGLIIWEMIALAVPHVNLLGADGEDDSFDEDMDDSVCDDAFQNALGTRPPLPNIKLGSEYQPLIELFCACTDEDPKKRPSANVALKVLEDTTM